VLAPLAALAERCALAVLALMHFSKSATDALLGVGGSIGFVGAARSLLIFGADPNDARGEDGPSRVLAHRKSNVGRRRRSLQVWVQGRVIEGDTGPIETSVAVVGDECDVDADQLVRPREKKESPRAQAEKFLRHLLADGPMKAAEIQELAVDEGIAVKTLRRAKKDLGVTAFQKDRTWWWELPGEDDDLPPEDELPPDGEPEPEL
jgi:putative DNA primase/helicase